MKKILVIHNKYRQLGGEDIAVENELIMLKKNYEVKELYFNNNIKNYSQLILSFVLNKNLKSMLILKKTIKEFNPDVAYVHNTWLIASTGIFKVLEKNKIKTILKIHNFRYYCTRTHILKNHIEKKSFCGACGNTNDGRGLYNKYFNESYIKSFFVNRYGKKYFKILKKNDLVILVLTNFHKQFLIKLGINKNKIKVVQNYIEIQNIVTSPNQENQIVYAGRISKEKGVEELILSFKSTLLNSYSLLIIGDGPELKKLIKKYQSPNIIFLGNVDNKEVLRIISSSIAVVTSTKLFEGQPTLLCEAASLGVPALFPNTGGINEFFPKDYKLSFQQFDYEDLKNKLKLIEDKKFSKYIGNKSREFFISNFNYKILIKKFDKILNDL